MKKDTELKKAIAAKEQEVQKAVSEVHAVKDKEIASHKNALTKKEAEHAARTQLARTGAQLIQKAQTEK